MRMTNHWCHQKTFLLQKYVAEIAQFSQSYKTPNKKIWPHDCHQSAMQTAQENAWCFRLLKGNSTQKGGRHHNVLTSKWLNLAHSVVYISLLFLSASTKMLCNTYQEQSFHKMGKCKCDGVASPFWKCANSSQLYHSDNNVSRVVNER